MKLKCLIGSLSCDGTLAEKGDIFELPDAAAKSVIELGYAIEALDEEPKDKEDTEDGSIDEGVQGVSRHDGTKIVKPQKRNKK